MTKAERARLAKCWYREQEPKCPANKRTGECYLWSADSFVFHMPNQKAPAYCPLSGRRIPDCV